MYCCAPRTKRNKMESAMSAQLEFTPLPSMYMSMIWRFCSIVAYSFTKNTAKRRIKPGHPNLSTITPHIWKRPRIAATEPLDSTDWDFGLSAAFDFRGTIYTPRREFRDLSLKPVKRKVSRQ